MSRPLASIVRTFGVEPDAIRLISHARNTHWRVSAGARRYVLRRFGHWSTTEGDVAWEVDVLRRLASHGLPVAAPLGDPQEIDGGTWLLMPWLAGRRQSPNPSTDAEYRRLGALLAEVHAVTREIPPPAQRPGWSLQIDGAFPLAGGAERRAELLTELAKVDPGMAERFGEAAERLEARNLPAAFAGAPRMIVQGDFAPWNVRVTAGRLTGLLDFDLAHVDVRAGDVALGRRGYHDAVVEGYLEHATLSEVELANLDGLWTGGSLNGVWRVIEDRLAEDRLTTHGLEWNLEQLDKTRPYQPAAR